jgi:uncharacterized protein
MQQDIFQSFSGEISEQIMWQTTRMFEKSRTWWWLAAMVLSMHAANALSAEPAPQASPAPAVMAPEQKTATESAKPASDPAKEKPADAPAAPAPKPTPHIALIVPLASKTFSRVADAVKQGFEAGADAEGKNAAAYRIYPADDDAAALATLYRKAVGEGATAIIGGVTRDGANAIVKEAGYVPTLSLNAPSTALDGDGPDKFFYVSLNVDWEARLVARAAAQEGFKRATIVAGNAAIARRIADSIEKEWLRAGGEISTRLSFVEASEATRLRGALERAKADVVFLSLDARTARLARPYLPSGTPVYATSQSLDARAGAVANLDLDGVRILEMPWLVEKDHPAVMAYNKPADGTPLDYERLYALGIDAWRLTQLILKADKPRSIPPLDGVTGKLTLDGAQFVRTLATVEIRDGLPIVSRSAD